jgi:CHAD domain-containing protein
MVDAMSPLLLDGDQLDGYVELAGIALHADPEPWRTEQRTLLDTFDWRLWRAGTVLQAVPDAGGSTMLTWRSAGDGAVRASGRVAGALDGPLHPGEVPVGPLRAALPGLTGGRALLPVATATARSLVVAARNGDGKVVARVVFDQFDGTEPTMRLEPVRGYDAAARKADQALAEAMPEWSTLRAVPSATSTGPDPASGGSRAVPSSAAASPLDATRVPAAARSRIEAPPGAAGAPEAVEETAEPAPLLELYRSVLDRGGRRPGGYRPKLSVRVTAGEPAGAVVTRALTVMLDAMVVNVDGAAEAVDSGFLHDLRVGVRRTRSMLRHARGVLPEELVACFGPEWRWFQGVTGPVRDLDVLTAVLAAGAAGSSGGSVPADLRPLAELLERRRAVAQATLADDLRSDRLAALLSDWRATLDDLAASPPAAGAEAGEWGPWPPEAGEPVEVVAADRIERALKRVVKGGRSISDHSAPEELHRVRTLAKQLRYLVEVFGKLYPAEDRKPLVRDLKVLQDNLGAFQDSEVHALAVAELAGELTVAGAPMASVAAAGRLVGELHARQVAARAEFHERFDAFATPENRRRFTELVPGRAEHR